MASNSARTRRYNAALSKGDYFTCAQIDREMDREWDAAHPVSAQACARFADIAYTSQQRAACWDDADASQISHDPRD